MWDPEEYGRYAGERARPFAELLARVAADRPETVVDLGCGTGELTATLSGRWPAAQVLGIDSSPEMLARANALARPPALRFAPADIAGWEPETPVDVLVSNAALQWLPDHPALLRRLLAAVAPGGWFAFQVPGNFDEPSHALLRGLAAGSRWSRWLAGTTDLPKVLSPESYLDLLSAAGWSADVWESTYLHVLTGPDPVLHWLRAAGLRPVLAALPTPERPVFEAEFGAALRAAYPDRAGRTLLPFRRIFAVARRPID